MRDDECETCDAVADWYLAESRDLHARLEAAERECDELREKCAQAEALHPHCVDDDGLVPAEPVRPEPPIREIILDEHDEELAIAARDAFEQYYGEETPYAVGHWVEVVRAIRQKLSPGDSQTPGTRGSGPAGPTTGSDEGLISDGMPSSSRLSGDDAASGSESHLIPAPLTLDEPGRPEASVLWSTVDDRVHLDKGKLIVTQPVKPEPSDEELARDVRIAWVEWAKTQPDPKRSWLVPWEDLNETDREADRYIASAIRKKLLGDVKQERDQTPGVGRYSHRYVTQEDYDRHSRELSKLWCIVDSFERALGLPDNVDDGEALGAAVRDLVRRMGELAMRAEFDSLVRRHEDLVFRVTNLEAWRLEKK